MFHRARLFSGFLGLFLFSTSVLADWESKFSAVSSKGDFPNISGKIFARTDRVRVDSPYPMEMSVYAKSGSKQVFAAVHSFHIRLSSTQDAFSAPLFSCLAKSFEACVAALKLKKVGSEKCGEQTCDLFEGDPKLNGVKSVKLWHWAGDKEAILAKAIIFKITGGTVTAIFSEIIKKTRPDSFFKVPEDYKDAGALDRFFGDLHGKSGP